MAMKITYGAHSGWSMRPLTIWKTVTMTPTAAGTVSHLL